MRRFVLFVGLAMAASLAGCSEPADPPSTAHVGLWESVWRGTGGAANSFELDADSGVTRFFLKAYDFQYEISGDSLFVEPTLHDSLAPHADSVRRQAIHWSIKGDTLIRSQPGHTEWLARSGPAPAGPESIVGEWQSIRSTDAITINGYQRYSEDGILEVRLPMSVKAGIYRRTSDSLVFYLRGNDTTKCTYLFRGDTLDISSTHANGTFTYSYLRASLKSWYELEEL
jgi:hypothetical protein